MRFGFCGPAYKSQSALADAEDLINLYLEQTESPNARTQYALYTTPGLSPFVALSTSVPSVRGLYTASGRTFAVAGTHLYEIFGSGSAIDYGGNPGTGNNNIVDDGLPAVMVAGGNIQSAGIISAAVPDSGNPGTGFHLGDTLSVVGGGGMGAILSVATVSALGAITAAVPDAGDLGLGFHVGDTLSVTGGGGSGAVIEVATATPAGAITVAVPHSGDPGSGFSVGNTLSVTGGGGLGAVLTVATESGGVPESYTVTDAGTGYSTGSAVSLSVLTGSGTPGTADITAPVGGVPETYGIVDAGTGYTTTASVSLLVLTGTGTAGTADITAPPGGNPETYNIVNQGIGYSTTPSPGASLSVLTGSGTAGAADITASTVGAGIYPSQLLISSGGVLTVFSMASNSFLPISGAPTNVLMIDFMDGFFIALTAANTFYISNPEDCTTWTGLSVSQVSVFSDKLLSLIASNRLLWVFGAQRAVCYYNAGAPIFPFAVVNGGFMEVGILAQFSVARVSTKAGTTIMWLSGDERGAAVVFAANGFIPQRVSDHGLEYWLSQNRATISDAVGYAMQDQGHNFYVLNFPTANMTWVLDVDLGFWHKRSSLVNGVQGAHRAFCHTYNFGQHLVGDRASGSIFSMDISYLTENISPGVNNPIIRTRIGPTISDESSWIPTPINEFQVDFETGLGPIPPLTDGFGNPRDPYAVFSYSEDFGKTWTADRIIPCGQAGNYLTAAIDRRLGSWRSFTPKVTMSDPIAWRIVDAYVNATQSRQSRLAKTFAKIT